MALLEAIQVTKDFGGLRALNDVDLSIEEGDIFSLIGPNGAGKTTMFNLITGIFFPTKGSIVFKGIDLTKPAPVTGPAGARSTREPRWRPAFA